MEEDFEKELHKALNDLAASLGISVVVKAASLENEICDIMTDAAELLLRIRFEQASSTENKPGISNWEELSYYLKQGMDSVGMTTWNEDGSLNEVFFNNMEFEEAW